MSSVMGMPLAVGRTGWVRGIDAERQRVMLILATEPGECPLRPTFGCGLERFLFSAAGPGVEAAVSFSVERALARWAPDLHVLSVGSVTRAGTLRVRVSLAVQGDHLNVEVVRGE